MYCLEKFQRELAYFLDIDLRDLPKVQEILKAQGYTAVKKNDEIIQLGGGKVSKEQVEKLKEVVEKPTPKVDNAEVLQINADEAITKLHSTQGQPIPQEIDIQTFKNVLESIENQDNFITHLQKKQDAQSRLAYLNLVEPTLKEWDIKLTKGDRKELIKVFNDGDNFFTLLITEQDNKRLITFIPKARDGYIESKIKNADLIQTFTSRASESKAEWTRVANSTTNNLKWQQDGNVLRSVVELDNGEKLLLSKDRLENVYIQSNHIEQVNSYDELILQESLEKFAKDELENKLAKQIESISQFGENYPQFYHKAHEAIQHLLHTKSGQVQGAFYRDEIGDITLAWGEKGTGKSDGWGLAKIVEYHPEVLDKLDELVQNLPIVKENANRYQLENDMYKLSIRKDFEGQKENWILTAFEKDESIARRRTDLPSSQSEAEKTTSANATDIIPQKSSKATSQISKEIKDIIDSSPQKGRDMQIIGEANFTPQVVEYAHKNNKKVAIDKLSQAEAEKLGYKYPNDVRVTIDYSAINHTLNRHGAESALVKNSGQKAVDYGDIAEYRNIVKGADESLDSVDNMGTPVVVSYKQINGHFVVVEEIRKGQNELNFKTMFKQEGNYKDSESYKKTSQSSNATEGYEPTANSFALTKKGYKPDLPTPNNIIPQNLLKAQSEYFNSLTNEYEKIKEIKKLHTQDDNLIRVMKVDGRNDYIEPLSNMSVSKEYLQKQTAQSLKENITQAILGNQTQLKVLQQGYNIYHLSSFQKEILESALDIANNPTKLKEYKLQGLQKQLNNLNSNEAYHIEKGRKYDKARYAKDREELEKEITALKGTESSLESAPQKVDSSDIIFTDKKGKEHTLTKEVQEQWLNTFNLKSLDEAYTPKHSDEILQALGGKEIKLQLGSLKKLVAQGREQYIPQIKEVLDSPEAIMRDDMGEYLFIKHLKDDDYFVNVSFDNGEYLVSISNGIKETRNLNNKLEKGGSFIYQSPNFNSISQKLLQTSQYSANKIDNDIIPQMPKDNPQLVALQTKIQQSRQQIAESKNPDKEYLYQVFKPDEIIELEKQYFNQAMPQEYKELIQDFPRLYEQSLANELKTYAKDTDTIQEVTTNLLNDFKDKPFKNTAKHAELLLFNTLRDKAQELGFKEMDINTPRFKVAFGKFQARLKKGDIQDLSEHIAIISLRKNRLRIEQSLNIKPLAEFGTNYAEHYHSGQSAIQKLLLERNGQVSGAFYRKELGDIDLVWGDSSFGLKHILDKHGSEFENIAKELDEIIQNGEVVKRKGRDEAYNIEYKGFKVGINKGFNKQGENKWVVTAFDDNIEKTAKTAPANDSTKGASLPLNSSTIIPQKSTKLQSNAHLGSGLVGGSVSGIESDENGNLTFSPEKFALGLLGGAVGSKVISSGYKRFLEKKPQRIIPLINKQKYTEPRFEVTKELEKTYRNAQVKPNEKIKETLKLSGVIKGDFIKLAQKHPEYFANPQEAKDLCDYVFQNAFIGLQASDKKQALIIAKLQDSNNDYGSVAFRIQNINGEHRIRSVILMEQKQVDLKIQNAKKLGEPIFHFW